MPASLVTPEVNEIALTLMEELDCPRSLGVAILLRYGEWEQILSLDCSPRSYTDANSYYLAAVATGFFSKLNSDQYRQVGEAHALQKWWDAERQCFATNRRLYEFLDFGTIAGSPAEDWLVSYIATARKKLRELLGRAPSLDSLMGRFGPGATMSDPSRKSTVLHKLSSTPTLTASALPTLPYWARTAWGRAVARRDGTINEVRGNAFFTVDKSALKRRACAKEPSYNVFFQLAIGTAMKKGLARHGIDLENGQATHRRVACEASLTGAYSTIDLSSASDTLATSLVTLLLPDDWRSLTDAFRSPFTRVDDRWIRLEKYASMGNGFTFELETAIFAALVWALDPDQIRPGKEFWAFGDDLIVPTRLARDVVASLKFFGFTPNPSKTFLEGPFRESCGGDFWGGVAVRPHFLKELPVEPQDYISLANGLRRVAIQYSQVPGLLLVGRRAWFKVLDCIPRHIRRCRGPEILGDLCVHDDQERWDTSWRRSVHSKSLIIEGPAVRVWRPIGAYGPTFNRFDEDVQMAAALYGVSLNTFKGREFVPARDSVRGYALGWAHLSAFN